MAGRAAFGNDYIGWGSDVSGAKTSTPNTKVRLAAADNQLTLSGASGASIALKGLAPPTAGGDAATKSYVDSARVGLHVLAPVDYASTATFATKASKGGSDTDIVPDFNAEPSTLTITGTNGGTGHTMNDLFNANNQIATGTLTFREGDTILIRNDFGDDFTGLSADNAKKCHGKWYVSTYTDDTNMVLTRTYDMQSADQYRNGVSIMVKSGAQAGNIYFQSTDFDRNLIDSQNSNANLEIQGAHGAGSTTLTTNLSQNFDVTAASFNYGTLTVDAHNLHIPQGTAIIIDDVYYRTSQASAGNKNIVIEGGLTRPLTGGEHIRIGICLRGPNAADSDSGVSHVPKSDDPHGPTWTQFAAAATAGAGLADNSNTWSVNVKANELEIYSDDVGVANNFSKTDFSALTMGMTGTGAMDLQMANNAATAFKLRNGTNDEYLSCVTSTGSETITLGATSVAGLATTINGGTGLSAISLKAGAAGVITVGDTAADNDIVVGGAVASGSHLTLQCGTEGFTFDFDAGATGVNTMTLGANLADALSIVNGAVGDLVVYDTTTNAVTVTYSADLYANAHLTNSDVALKKNIETVDGALSMVDKMRGVTWDWKDEKKHNTSCGVVAQELMTVLPCAVREPKNEKDHMRVNYSALSGVFIEAIKELKDKVDRLEKEKKALEQEEEESPKTVTTKRYNLRRRRRTRA